MKKNIFYAFILIVFFGTSCIKDQTNTEIKPVSPILIDTAGVPKSFGVYQFDTLKTSLKVRQDEVFGDHLKHEWVLNGFSGYKRVLSTDTLLSAVITEGPGPYALLYTVTDTITNMKSFFKWDLSVATTYGPGLIVAHTHDDLTSDLGLIMAYNFNPSFGDTTTRVYKNLYSLANSQKIDGVVKGLGYMKFQTVSMLTAITDNSIIKVDPLSYKYTGRDNDAFFLPVTIKPTSIQSVQPTNVHEYIVNNGKLHGKWFQQEKSFGYHFLIDGRDYHCTVFWGLQRPNPVGAGGLLYDDKNNRFLMAPSIMESGDPLIAFPKVDVSAPFDPANMGNKECLHIEEGQSNRLLAIMKDKGTNKYGVYQVKINIDPLDGNMGHSVNDISNNPEISNSKYFTCSTAENVLYYATDDKIYSTTLLPDGATIPVLRYTAKNGDKITAMRTHRMPGFMFLPSLVDPSDYELKRTFPSTNRVVVISTYNEGTKEGKIVSIPIESLGVGGLIEDPTYITTIGGFDRITAFNYQNP